MFLLFLFFGIIGGVFGGMGMGGGTFLIPLLTVLGGVPQKISQSVNLISFLPMSVIALYIHFKSGLVDVKSALLMVVPALFFAVLGSILAQYVDGEMLKKFFGAFLIVLSVVMIIKKRACKS